MGNRSGRLHGDEEMKLLRMRVDVVAKVNDEELAQMMAPDNQGVIFEMFSMDDNATFSFDEVDQIPEGAQVVDWTHE